MAKLIKNKYYTSKGEAKINSYLVAINKEIVEKSGFTGNENIVVKAGKNKIIIEKSEE